jgi:hypothetical protein
MAAVAQSSNVDNKEGYCQIVRIMLENNLTAQELADRYLSWTVIG